MRTRDHTCLNMIMMAGINIAGYWLWSQFRFDVFQILFGLWRRSWNPLDSLIAVALGSCLVDYDLMFYGKAHRETSPFHWIEVPIVAIIAMLAFHWFGENVGFVPEINPSVYKYLIGMMWGWLFHLVGDMLQGGVYSRLLKRRIGRIHYTWDKYENDWVWLTPLLVVAALFTAYKSFVAFGVKTWLWGYMLVTIILIGKTESRHNLVGAAVNLLIWYGIMHATWHYMH